MWKPHKHEHIGRTRAPRVGGGGEVLMGSWSLGSRIVQVIGDVHGGQTWSRETHILGWGCQATAGGKMGA